MLCTVRGGTLPFRRECHVAHLELTFGADVNVPLLAVGVHEFPEGFGLGELAEPLGPPGPAAPSLEPANLDARRRVWPPFGQAGPRKSPSPAFAQVRGFLSQGE